MNINFGEMAEWSKAAASKAVIPIYLGIEGSNPSLSSSLRLSAPSGSANYAWRSQQGKRRLSGIAFRRRRNTSQIYIPLIFAYPL
jgi:hypothetical protein